jgi:hypothetical protein
MKHIPASKSDSINSKAKTEVPSSHSESTDAKSVSQPKSTSGADTIKSLYAFEKAEPFVFPEEYISMTPEHTNEIIKPSFHSLKSTSQMEHDASQYDFKNKQSEVQLPVEANNQSIENLKESSAEKICMTDPLSSNNQQSVFNSEKKVAKENFGEAILTGKTSKDSVDAFSEPGLSLSV